MRDKTLTMSEDADTSSTEEQSEATEGSDSHVESDTFKPIASQAEFDAAIKQRLARAEKAAERKYTTQVKELESIVHAFENEKLSEDEKRNKKLEELTAALAERDTTIKGYERDKLVTNLAAEHDLPRKFWDRVRGDTEEDIAADIQELLDALPKPDEKAPKKSGTVKVQSTGDDGEQALSADEILAAIDPNYKKS